MGNVPTAKICMSRKNNRNKRLLLETATHDWAERPNLGGGCFAARMDLDEDGVALWSMCSPRPFIAITPAAAKKPYQCRPSTERDWLDRIRVYLAGSIVFGSPPKFVDRLRQSRFRARTSCEVDSKKKYPSKEHATGRVRDHEGGAGPDRFRSRG